MQLPFGVLELFLFPCTECFIFYEVIDPSRSVVLLHVRTMCCGSRKTKGA